MRVCFLTLFFYYQLFQHSNFKFRRCYIFKKAVSKCRSCFWPLKVSPQGPWEKERNKHFRPKTGILNYMGHLNISYRNTVYIRELYSGYSGKEYSEINHQLQLDLSLLQNLLPWDRKDIFVYQIASLISTQTAPIIGFDSSLQGGIHKQQSCCLAQLRLQDCIAPFSPFSLVSLRLLCCLLDTSNTRRKEKEAQDSRFRILQGAHTPGRLGGFKGQTLWV